MDQIACVLPLASDHMCHGDAKTIPSWLFAGVCSSERTLWFVCMEAVFLVSLLMSLLSYDREGQPLKLPDTKRTLLFTFNGKCPLRPIAVSLRFIYIFI